MFNVLSSATEVCPAHIQGYVLVVSYVTRRGNYCCGVLVACSVSVFNRPVAIAYLIVARTASMFGAHFSGSDSALPPK